MHVSEDLVRVAPVEPTGLGLDPVPAHWVPHLTHMAGSHEGEVVTPTGVVLGGLCDVLVVSRHVRRLERPDEGNGCCVAHGRSGPSPAPTSLIADAISS